MRSPHGQSQRSAFSHFSQDGLRKGEGRGGRPGGGGERGEGGGGGGGWRSEGGAHNEGEEGEGEGRQVWMTDP